MELYFKDSFIFNNEFLFYGICASVLIMIVICFAVAVYELKNNK